MKNSPYGILGQQAPELAVTSWIDGKGQARKPFTLADCGDTVKVMYCFQSWCPGCHSSGFPTLQAITEHYADSAIQENALNVCVVQTVFEGHDINTADKLRETQQRYQLEIPFGHDAASPRPKTMQDYRTGGTPWYVIIDRNNRVIYNDFHIDIELAIKYIDASLTPVGDTQTQSKRYEAKHNPAQNRYSVRLNDKHEAFLIYRKRDDVLYLDHTEVPQELRGQGYGNILMEAVLEKIERQGFKIVPVCNFTRNYLKRYKRWAGLLLA